MNGQNKLVSSCRSPKQVSVGQCKLQLISRIIHSLQQNTNNTHLTDSCIDLGRICDPSQAENVNTMAPRPRTYGTRRSHAKAAGELVNGTTADGPGSKLGKIDVIFARVKTGQGEDLGTSEGEEKQATLSHGLGKEDEPATATQVVEPAALSHVPTVEDISISVSPTSGSHKNRRISAQDMSPPDKIIEEKSSRRKSIRKLVNGSGSSRDQDNTTINGSGPISVDHTFPSRAKESSRPNGFINGQQSPVGGKVDLKDTPSDLHDLPIWVAQSISRLSDKSPLSAISEPSQNDFGSHPEQDVEMTDALDNLEGVRMTRGKEKKRLQELKGKGKEPVNGMSPSSLRFMSFLKRW